MDKKYSTTCIKNSSRTKMSLSFQQRTNWTLPPPETKPGDNQSTNSGKSTISLGGLWHAIHRTAMQPDFPFNKWIRDQINHLPCETCRKHALVYLNNNPPESDNAVTWAWRFHNNVNRRLGKKTITLSECRKQYSDNSVPCKSCSG